MSDTSLVFTILAKDRASETFDKLKDHAAVAGAAIGVALAAGVVQAMEKTKTDALLAAQLGASPEMAATLGQASGDLYARGVVDSIETGNAAIKSAIQNALVPPDASAAALDAVGAKITGLGAIMQEDADRVSSAVSQMLRTGVAGSAEEAFDLLTAATQKGLNKSGDLLDTLNEYGTQFRVLGLAGPQALGLISQALQAGARDSDVAADALKEFAIRSQDGSKAAAASFAALGLNAEQMRAIFARGGPEAAAAMDLVLDRLRATQGRADAAQIAFGLFGTKAEDLGAALYAMDLTSAANQLGNVQGAAQRAGDTLEQSAGAKVEAFRRKVEMGLVEVLAVAAGWIERNADLLQTLAIVLGPLVVIIGGIVAVTRVWTAVQTALNVVMAANPLGLVVLAVVALVAILVVAWNSSAEFRAIVTGAFTAVSDAASWLGGKVGEVFTAIGNGAAAVARTVADWWNGVVTFVFGLPGRIGAAASGMWDGIVNGFKAAINWIVGGWNRLSFTVPPVDIPYVGTFGGFTVGVPQIPYLAKGGNITAAGMAVVGERGPELVSLPRGAQVTPLDRGGGAGTTNIIHVHGAVDPIGTARAIEQVLLKYSRETGRTSLGL